jgi:hypothetical protein
MGFLELVMLLLLLLLSPDPLSRGYSATSRIPLTSLLPPHFEKIWSPVKILTKMYPSMLIKADKQSGAFSVCLHK